MMLEPFAVRIGRICTVEFSRASGLLFLRVLHGCRLMWCRQQLSHSVYLVGKFTGNFLLF